MRNADEIRLDRTVKAPPPRVWRVLVAPELWWGDDVVLEPRLGGRFVEPWTEGGIDRLTKGKVVTFEPPRRLTLRWKDEDWSFETAVEISLSESGADTRVDLIHRGWDAAPPDQRPRLIASHRSGWRHHLRNLAAHTEAATGKLRGDRS